MVTRRAQEQGPAMPPERCPKLQLLGPREDTELLCLSPALAVPAAVPSAWFSASLGSRAPTAAGIGQLLPAWPGSSFQVWTVGDRVSTP